MRAVKGVLQPLLVALLRLFLLGGERTLLPGVHAFNVGWGGGRAGWTPLLAPLPARYDVPANASGGGAYMRRVDVAGFEFAQRREDGGEAEAPSALLQRAFSRYGKLLARPSILFEADSAVAFNASAVAPGDALRRLEVVLAGDGAESSLGPDMDEAYSLNVTAGGARLSAASVWGALRGLETFSQLVFRTAASEEAYVNMTRISDAPRFKYRGLLVDTGHHYLPRNLLFQILDAMAYSKLNVLHWHLVDDQAFPYEATTKPELAARGALSQNLTYSAADVAAVVAHARDRGVRVVAELDAPSHAGSWGRAHPELMAGCKPSPDGTTPLLLDASRKEAVTFAADLLKDVAGAFPDPYLHVGGRQLDIAGTQCYRADKELMKRAQAQGLATAEALVRNYHRRIANATVALGKTPLLWAEAWNAADRPPLSNATTVLNIKLDGHSSWQLLIKAGGAGLTRWQAKLGEATRRGFRVVLSAPFDLDLLNLKDQAKGSDLYNGWQIMYHTEFDSTTYPMRTLKEPVQAGLVLGGQASLWGEYVGPENAIPYTWSRVMAVAERLWSRREVKDEMDATRRFRHFTCLLIQRDINVRHVDMARSYIWVEIEVGGDCAPTLRVVAWYGAYARAPRVLDADET